jgi:hypothetical protein
MQRQSLATASQVFDRANALSDANLKEWCVRNKLKFHIVELANLDKLVERRAFIFTGNVRNEQNQGNTHHWMFVDGRLIFDSYGDKSVYSLPGEYKFIKTTPRRLQEYNSVVCGEYCCAVYKLLSEYNERDPEQIGEAYCEEYGFGANRSLNDRIVAKWYEKTGGKALPNDRI